MNIRDILALSPEDQIAAVEAGDISDAIVYVLPLDTALTNFSVEISGNYFSCISGTDVNTNADIQFNKVEPNNGNAINFTQGLTTIRPFARFYVTATAQAGKTIKFLIATSYPLFGIQDNRSNTVQASYLADIADQLKGGVTAGTFNTDVSITAAAVVLAADSLRRSGIIFADKTNTDYVHIGFSTTVTSSKKVVTLDAGESFIIDDYRGDISAVANSGTQKISCSSW